MKIGVRVVGLQVWNSEKSVYGCLNKYRGRELDEDGLRNSLLLFLKPSPEKPIRLDLCRRFLQRINKLYQV